MPGLVAAAVARIDEGCLDEGTIDDLARALGVTARHLRRAMERELGVSPIALAQSRRLALAKQLLHDTALGLADVAFASGFKSVRRFNALFAERFGRAPSSIRRELPRAPAAPRTIALRLGYRPPLAWGALLAFLRDRAIPSVEEVQGDVYRRTVRVGDRAGTIEVADEPSRASLVARVPLELAAGLVVTRARLRALFDLDAEPSAIATALARDPVLRRAVRETPGLRVPGAYDPFEAAVRAILGQQVSVRAATTLAGRLVERFGEARDGVVTFPSASALAAASVDDLASLGLVSARARSVVALASAIDRGALRLDRSRAVDETLAALEALPGIGPWTAQYVAMRALGWPDAFPATDLGVRKALRTSSEADAIARVEPLRPFRAYAVMHLWALLAGGSR